MAQIDAKIEVIRGPQDARSRALGAGLNLTDGVFDANLFRKPDYYIYIYTTSNREFTISQPPLFPRLIIPPCPVGERYLLVGRIPHPFQQVDREGAVGDLMVRGHKAEQVAMSLMNPNNLTLDQDSVPPEKSISGLGVDLNAQGLFWSRNEPPTEAELKAATNRRERYYKGLIEKARVLEISNPKELEASLNQDFHMAAEYFGISTTWHKEMIKKEVCPLCGGDMIPGVAIHITCGGVLNWDKAIASGLRKEEDRPKVSTGTKS